MKKTFNINIAGFPFIIDEDAYHLLKNYFDAIGHAFASHEDGRAIADDIENRVAELLLEIQSNGKKIITYTDIEIIISRIGQPDEIIETEESIQTDASGNPGRQSTEEEIITPPPYIPPVNDKPNVIKKLYRDPQDALLGGVCSGIARYLNMDPVIVRLITVLLTLLSATTCGIAYIILWIIIPEARTPLQRLQMMGEAPTVENIGKSVMGEDMSTIYTQKTTGFWDVTTRCFAVLAKIIFGLIVFAVALALIGIVVGAIVLIVAIVTGGACNFGNPFKYTEGGTLLFYSILGIAGVLIILITPIYFWRNRVKYREGEIPVTKRNSLIGLFIIGVIVTWLSGVKIGKWISLFPEKERQFKEMSFSKNEADSIKEKHKSVEITIDTVINGEKNVVASFIMETTTEQDSIKEQ